MNPDDIKQARERLGLSLRDLEAKSGVSASSISRFESGKSIKYSAMLKIYAALDLEAPGVSVKGIEERELIAAWRDKDYSLILLMIAKKIDNLTE